MVPLAAMVLATQLPTSAPAQQDDPRSPGPEHKKLDALAGKWDVAVTFKLGPDQERKGTADCEAKWDLDGRFLRQVYTSDFQGRPFVVVQLLGFDRLKKKVIELKMDNMDTGVMHNEGTISDDGKTITCTGERTDPLTGKPDKIRTVYTIQDKDHYTLEWYLPDPQGNEVKTVTLAHTRKKDGD
jgi:hypothetical protein